MIKLSVPEMIDRIRRETCFEAVSDDYSFTLKIDSYVPYLCGAVHDGHQFRKELWENCLHSQYDRWFEEDPCTKEMVRTHPIVIAGCDSRFEYDLNRAPDVAIYQDAWGKQLWRKSLTDKQKETSLQKHHNFYNVVHALVEQLESKFGSLVVYDMHSYNWRRWDRAVPVINLGTVNVDSQRFGTEIQSWSASLGGIQLPYGIESTSKINDTFQGNGYFLKYITSHFNNTLVLATEFKKIYCDERTGVIYPEVVRAIETELLERIPEHADAFYKNHRP